MKSYLKGMWVLRVLIIILLVPFLAACSSAPVESAPESTTIPKLVQPVELTPEVTSTAIKPSEKLTCANQPTEFTIEENPKTPPPGFKQDQDLLNWTTQLVKAYGGKIIVNEKDLDAEQLSADILGNLDSYIKNKEIAGNKSNFLVVEGIPLAVCQENGYWQEATLRDFGDLLGIKIGTLMGDPNISGIFDPSFWENEYHTAVACLDNPNIAYEAPFDWEWNDWQIQTAKRNKLEIRIQPILNPGYIPAWLSSDYTDENLDHMTRIIVDYAKEQDVKEIVVANECTPAMMDDITRTFRLTKELFPEAKLIYNDTHNHFLRYNYSNVSSSLKISENLHQLGLIDYVGVEMHIDKDTLPKKDEIINVFKKFPVPVVITEFDALLTYLPEDKKDAKLEEITRIVFDGCIESGVCVGITTWGENDGTGWESRSLLRDAKNIRKSAYYAAMQSMYEHLP